MSELVKGMIMYEQFGSKARKEMRLYWERPFNKTYTLECSLHCLKRNKKTEAYSESR